MHTERKILRIIIHEHELTDGEKLNKWIFSSLYLTALPGRYNLF